jgi:hypothetical protein
VKTIKIIFLNIRGRLIFFPHVVKYQSLPLSKMKTVKLSEGGKKGDHPLGEATPTGEEKRDLSSSYSFEILFEIYTHKTD